MMKDEYPHLVLWAGKPIIVCAPVTTDARHRKGRDAADWLYYVRSATYTAREGCCIQKIMT